VAIATTAETANSAGRTTRESWSRMKFLMASFPEWNTCRLLKTPAIGVYSRRFNCQAAIERDSPAREVGSPKRFRCIPLASPE